MKKLTLCGLFAVLLAGLAGSAQAKDRKHNHDRDRDRDRSDYYDSRSRDYDRYDRDRYDHGDRYHSHSDRTRTVWVVEGNRLVKRVVYVDSGGRYYRQVYGRRVYVSSRTYTSFPSKYYHSDGRRRSGITIRF